MLAVVDIVNAQTMHIASTNTGKVMYGHNVPCVAIMYNDVIMKMMQYCAHTDIS